MNTHADKTPEHQSSSVAGSLSSREGHVQSLPFTDNRPEAIAQRRLKTLMQSQPLKVPGNKLAGEPVPQGNFETVQKKENNTGLPDNLKTGIENLSGIDISDVKVHYNSEKPSQLQAHAYAQGSEIHVAPGQEQHLPHEAWHVVQQKQGRVKPTLQMRSGVRVNDDTMLEREADVMGTRAFNDEQHSAEILSQGADNGYVQRVVNIHHAAIDNAHVDGLNEDDFEAQLNGINIDRVRGILKSWIALDEVKPFANDAVAIQDAVAAIEQYNEFAAEAQEQVLMNEYTIGLYNTAGFDEDARMALFNLLGRDNFESLDEDHLPVLHDIYTNSGVRSIERLIGVNNFNILTSALADLDDFRDLIDALGEPRMVHFLNNATIAELNALFQNMSEQHVNTLSNSVAVELAGKTPVQIAGIEGQWAGLSPWLDTADNLNRLLALTANGYTYAECSTLRGYNLSPAEARTLQQNVVDFATLTAFIDEARRYRVSNANMIVIAQDNAGAAYLVLQGDIRGRALGFLDKNANYGSFASWINVINNLIADVHYTLAIGAVVDLGGNTFERLVTVRDNLGNNIDTFVIHYHPGVQDAGVGNPMASPRHIKPIRGNLQTPRMLWPEIPGGLRDLLPGNHH